MQIYTHNQHGKPIPLEIHEGEEYLINIRGFWKPCLIRRISPVRIAVVDKNVNRLEFFERNSDGNIFIDDIKKGD